MRVFFFFFFGGGGHCVNTDLGWHDLGIGARYVDSRIQASSVMGLYHVPTVHLGGPDTAVIRTCNMFQTRDHAEYKDYWLPYRKNCKLIFFLCLCYIHKTLSLRQETLPFTEHDNILRQMTHADLPKIVYCTPWSTLLLYRSSQPSQSGQDVWDCLSGIIRMPEIWDRAVPAFCSTVVPYYAQLHVLLVMLSATGGRPDLVAEQNQHIPCGPG